MKNSNPGLEICEQAKFDAVVFGSRMAILTATLTAVTFAIAVLTPPLSGPLCASGCFGYPYSEAVHRFPRDYYWMYPALVLNAAYLVLVCCIHECAAVGKKVFSLAALSFAAVSAGTLIITYFVQISVVQPSLLKGETDGIALLTQYNPHGLFIALEEVGYLLLATSFLFISPVFSGSSRLERSLRRTLFAGFVLSIGGLILVALNYGLEREYRFELLVISITWIVLLITSILLALFFMRSIRERSVRRFSHVNDSQI